jgi:nucleotidyltransferase/DNA polymerase involved in DNA repair
MIDCRDFYVSCERVFDPRLARRPVVVLSNNDGCVISRSGEAKQIGVTMGAPYFQMSSLDDINRRFGRDTVKYAAVGLQQPWQANFNWRSPHYTTCWRDIPSLSPR